MKNRGVGKHRGYSLIDPLRSKELPVGGVASVYDGWHIRATGKNFTRGPLKWRLPTMVHAMVDRVYKPPPVWILVTQLWGAAQ